MWSMNSTNGCSPMLIRDDSEWKWKSTNNGGVFVWGYQYTYCCHWHHLVLTWGKHRSWWCSNSQKTCKNQKTHSSIEYLQATNSRQSLIRKFIHISVFSMFSWDSELQLEECLLCCRGTLMYKGRIDMLRVLLLSPTVSKKGPPPFPTKKIATDFFHMVLVH